jgi:hypothetical protein
MYINNFIWMQSIAFLVFTRPISLDPYRVPQKKFNLKHSSILKGVFRFKTASQFVEECHNVVSCAINVKNLL